MIEPTITDAGVFVALISERDQWHDWATAEASKLQPPFITCEAAIAEAAHLLKSVRDGQLSLLAFIEGGLVEIDFSLSAQIMEVKELMRKYADIPMDLADACLVRMSELHSAAKVFTVDGDFRIYRKNGKEQIPLIIPG